MQHLLSSSICTDKDNINRETTIKVILNSLPSPGKRKKKGRREVQGSIFVRACRSNMSTDSEFSVVFSEIHVNIGKDPLKRPPQRAHYRQIPMPRFQIRTIGLNPRTQPNPSAEGRDEGGTVEIMVFHILLKDC